MIGIYVQLYFHYQPGVANDFCKIRLEVAFVFGQMSGSNASKYVAYKTCVTRGHLLRYLCVELLRVNDWACMGCVFAHMDISDVHVGKHNVNAHTRV